MTDEICGYCRANTAADHASPFCSDECLEQYEEACREQEQFDSPALPGPGATHQ